jgi:hypothetical protein
LQRRNKPMPCSWCIHFFKTPYLQAMVESKYSTNIGYNAFCLLRFKNPKTPFISLYIFSHNFVNVKHMYEMWFGIDICWCVSKTKYNHFVHDVYLITHHYLTFFIIHHTFNQNWNFKIYMVPKFNANMKFKISLQWFKYVNMQILSQ